MNPSYDCGIKKEISVSQLWERERKRERRADESFFCSVWSALHVHTRTHTHTQTHAHTHTQHAMMLEIHQHWHVHMLFGALMFSGRHVWTHTHKHTHTHTHTPFPPFFKSPSIDFTLKFYCFCILLSQEITQNVKCSALSERLCLFCPEYLFKYQVVFNI